MTTHRKHRCFRRHRTYHALARCIWHRAVLIRGEGPYALIGAGRPLVISLWGTEAAARYAAARVEGKTRIEQMVSPKEAVGL